MTNGIYAAVLGSRIESLRLDIIANNIANADTSGYRSDFPVFKSHLDYIGDKDFDNFRKVLKNVSKYYGSKSSFQTAPIHYTGRKGDAAIDGDGFFAVQTPQGEAYTRSGNFRTDLEGNLITSGGNTVLGDGGPITIDQGKDFTIGADGTVFVGSEAVDKLRVADFDTKGLMKIGGNLFARAPGSAEKPEPKYTIVSESLEGSNVNIIREMVSMMTAGRQYEAYQRAIKMLDDVNNKSSSSLGRV